MYAVILKSVNLTANKLEQFRILSGCNKVQEWLYDMSVGVRVCPRECKLSGRFQLTENNDVTNLYNGVWFFATFTKGREWRHW